MDSDTTFKVKRSTCRGRGHIDSYFSNQIVINSIVTWQFRTSVFNKVVQWRRFGEVENVYVAYNFSHFAIYLPKFIKIGRNLTKL